MKGRTVIIAALLVAGCNTRASEGLLASELTWSQQENGWNKTIEISPWLATRPELVRRLRAERIAAMTKDADPACEPYENGTPSCEETWSYTVYHDGKRLVSIVAESTFDGGGAHPTTGYSDYLFDMERGEKIRFGDLFDSWARARPPLQKAFCEELHSRNPQFTCPAIEKQAITLSSAAAGGADGFAVDTQDYALGSYADGRETVRIELSPEIRSLIKPEYRSEFAAAAG